MATSEQRAEEDVVTQEQQVKAVTNDAQELFEDLMTRAQLSEKDKQDLQQRLE